MSRGGNDKGIVITKEELLQGLREGRYHNAEVVIRTRNGGAFIVAYNGDSKVHASAEPLYISQIAKYVSM